MAKGLAGMRRWLTFEAVLASPLPRSYTNYVGRWLLGAADTARQLAAFALITLGVLVTRWGAAPAVMRPLIAHHLTVAGLHLLPMTALIAAALGWAVVGQTVALLTRVGAQDYVGTVMVLAVVRELGPLATALVVLMRVGVPTVIQLGTARANGEVEALEALGIDPVHFLVVPRVIGMTVAVVALSAYLILGAVAAGFLFAFMQDVPLTPGEYGRQIAAALTWPDFLLLGLKSASFGMVIALASCFQGLARPLELREVAQASTTAVVAAVLGCVALDAAFIVVYLVL
jgi:phospholipid/cholesterol/gamma-HCH transport system permease protein